MTNRNRALTALILAALALPGAAGAQATRPGLWPERPLEQPKKDLRDAVIVLRDTLRAAHATLARMERAHTANASDAIMRSAGRTLVADCQRSARGAVRMQEHVKGLHTSEERGDRVLEKFRRDVLALEQGMNACIADVPAAIDPAPDRARLLAIRTRAKASIDTYERSVHELLRTLSIPLDPKGHKSAVEL